jgi:hypothetical protein
MPKHTFEYHPIETAPKDREIAILTSRGHWVAAYWQMGTRGNYWVRTRDGSPINDPYYWSEISDMIPSPVQEVVKGEER